MKIESKIEFQGDVEENYFTLNRKIFEIFRNVIKNTPLLIEESQRPECKVYLSDTDRNFLNELGVQVELPTGASYFEKQLEELIEKALSVALEIVEGVDVLDNLEDRLIKLVEMSGLPMKKDPDVHVISGQVVDLSKVLAGNKIKSFGVGLTKVADQHIVVKNVSAIKVTKSDESNNPLPMRFLLTHYNLLSSRGWKGKVEKVFNLKFAPGVMNDLKSRLAKYHMMDKIWVDAEIVPVGDKSIEVRKISTIAKEDNPEGEG